MHIILHCLLLYLMSQLVEYIKSQYINITFKAGMNSDIPLQTAAIFFLTNFYLKQGIG